MRKTIAHLQNQPHAVRTRVAVITATIVTAFIGLVLLTTLPLRFANVGGGSTANTAAVINATADNAGEQLSNIQNSWTQISTGLEVTLPEGQTDAQNKTTVPGQDEPQDAAFPQEGAQVAPPGF